MATEDDKEAEPPFPTQSFLSKELIKWGGDVLLARLTDDEEKRQRETVLSCRLQMSDYCKSDLIISVVLLYMFLHA